MKKIVLLVLVVLGLLAIVPAMELQSSTQVFSRVGMAEGDSGG
jgi:Tfp pilus assembly protein PilX